jgi:hypothetical protein
MRDRVYYILAIAVLLFAITALVVVFGQNRPIVSLQETESGDSLQVLFTNLASRINSDSQYSIRIRVAALSDGQAITVSQSGARIAEVGRDYFCLTNDGSTKVCYPFTQLLAVQAPS